jgi:cell division septum initiation protein DivIVA
MIVYKLLLFPCFVMSFADRIEDKAEIDIDNIFNEASNIYDELLNINRTNEITRKQLEQDLRIQKKSAKNL